MKTDVILLLNTTIMFIISFVSNNWQYRSYNFEALLPKLRQINCTIVGWKKVFEWERAVKVTCPVRLLPSARELTQRGPADLTIKVVNKTVTKYLVSEYGNLFRECNDLLEGQREMLFTVGVLYREKCNYFVTAPKTDMHEFRELKIIQDVEEINLVTGSLALITTVLAACFGVDVYFRTSLNSVVATGLCLTSSAVLYCISIACFMIKMYLIAERSAEISELTESDQLISQHSMSNVSWSFVAAVFSSLLSAASAYLYLASSKEIRDRRKHQLRRRQLQAALMSSCRQEVALAIRAKMTVI